jgi:hypothetical protein
LSWAESTTAAITADTISHMNGAAGTRAAAALRTPQLEAVVADADGSLLTGQKTRLCRPRRSYGESAHQKSGVKSPKRIPLLS